MTHAADSVSSADRHSVRRGFVKSTLLGTTALAMMPRGVHAQGSSTLRVGLIGCGGRGSGAASNVLAADKYANIVAMADLFSDRLNQSRQLLQRDKNAAQVKIEEENCFVGIDAYQKLIDHANVDVVCLCSPPHFRPMHLEAAIKAGKHVFCEKPIAVDPAGVRKVLEVARQAEEKKLNLVSGLCWRYDLVSRQRFNASKTVRLARLSIRKRITLLERSGNVFANRNGQTWNTRCETGCIIDGYQAITLLSNSSIAWISHSGCMTTILQFQLMDLADGRFASKKFLAMFTITFLWSTSGQMDHGLLLIRGKCPTASIR